MMSQARTSRPANILSDLEAVAYIPNFNGANQLAVLLDSLRAQEVKCLPVVVDNGSTDHSAEIVRSDFPEAEVLRLERNLGFGKALNRAISRFGGENIFLLNNDVECRPDFVGEMLARLEPGADMVAGVLTNAADPDLIDSAGVVADRRTLMAFDYLHDCRVEVVRHAAPPLAPTGGAALYRRDAFESVGGFDERIFAYYEDLDLALRMHIAGATCALAPDARATHIGSATLGRHSSSKYALTGWSRGYLARRYGIMESGSGAARTLFWETIICAGQLALDHTVSGLTGRLRGWRAAKGLSLRSLPDEGLLELSTRTAIRNRIRQRFNA